MFGRDILLKKLSLPACFPVRMRKPHAFFAFFFRESFRGCDGNHPFHQADKITGILFPQKLQRCV